MAWRFNTNQKILEIEWSDVGQEGGRKSLSDPVKSEVGRSGRPHPFCCIGQPCAHVIEALGGQLSPALEHAVLRIARPFPRAGVNQAKPMITGMFRLGVGLVIVGLSTISLAGVSALCYACPYRANYTGSCYQCDIPVNPGVALPLGFALVVAGIVALLIKRQPPNPAKIAGSLTPH